MFEVNDLIYIPFKTEKKMKETIIKMIFDGEVSRIVHTGSPQNLSIKKIKRILYSNVSSKNSAENTRKEYDDLINKSKFKNYCIFIKKTIYEESEGDTYYQKHKERLSRKMKVYYHVNKLKRKEYFKEYYRKNKMKINEL